MSLGLSIGPGIGRHQSAPGPELITNGTFDTDITGWTVHANHAASFSAGRLRIVAAATGFTHQSISTVPGRSYRASGRWFQVSGANFKGVRKADNNGASVNVVEIAITTGILRTTTFVATAATTFIICQVNGTDTVEFDDISVKEI